MDDQLEREDLYLRSTISTKLLNSTLKRGAWASGGGAILLILGGTLLPLSLLKIWGIPLFCMGMACISIGLIPYRKLTQLQFKPNAIHCNGRELLYISNGKPLFKIALNSLEKIAYLEKEAGYGMGLWLKKPIQEKVKVLQPRFNFARFMKHSMEDFDGCDLFLPYFSKHACLRFVKE